MFENVLSKPNPNKITKLIDPELGDDYPLESVRQVARPNVYLAENKDVNWPHLVMAPKAVLPNWKFEFHKWVPSIVVILYDGHPEIRKAIRKQYFGSEGKFCVMLTHYNMIMKDKQYLKKVHWYYMFIDEGHR